MSTEPEKKPDPLERLTPEQKQKLQNLVAAISYDRLTVSFSLDAKDANGMKRSAFFSLGVSRKAPDDSDTPVGFSSEEMRIVRCVVSKQVVATVYDDAVKRGLMPRSQAGEELKPILEAYDGYLAKLLGSSDPQ